MSITQLLTENGHRKVGVTYPDNNGNYVTTLRELGDRFLQESPEWRKQFFMDIIYKKEAYTNMGGHYELI